MNTPKKCMKAGTDGSGDDGLVRHVQELDHQERRRPSTGGVICPPVEEAASTAPAKLALVAHADHGRDGQRAHRDRVGHREPLSMPNMAEPNTLTFGRPAGVAPGDAGQQCPGTVWPRPMRVAITPNSTK